MPRRSLEDVVFDVLARVFNTCLGASIGLFFLGRRPRLLEDLFDLDRPTARAILTATGAAIGLLFGQKIWAAIDRDFNGKWGPPPP